MWLLYAVFGLVATSLARLYTRHSARKYRTAFCDALIYTCTRISRCVLLHLEIFVWGPTSIEWASRGLHVVHTARIYIQVIRSQSVLTTPVRTLAFGLLGPGFNDQDLAIESSEWKRAPSRVGVCELAAVHTSSSAIFGCLCTCHILRSM